MALLVLVMGDTQAKSFRVSQIPNGSVNSCSNCHINPGGGGTRNAFGQAVEAGFIGSNVDWGPTLAALDSDGDGATNGEELQDPSGSWNTGDVTPGSWALVTKPGDASSVPAAANNPPVLAAIGDRSADEGALLSFILTATDSDDDDVSFTVSGAPSGSSLTGATFSWTPSFSQSGTYNVTFTADDGQGDTDSETITITVDDLNQPPELSAIGDQTVGEAEGLSFTLSGTDPDGEDISFSAEDLPTGASLAEVTFEWTPGFDQSGVYSVTFTATDERGGGRL